MEPFVNPPSRYNPLFPIPSRPPQSWQGSCIYHKDFVPFTPHPSERHDFRVASYCDLLKNGTRGKGHMKTSLLKSCAIYGFVVKTRSEQKRKLMIGCSTKSFFLPKRIPLKTNKVGLFLKNKISKKSRRYPCSYLKIFPISNFAVDYSNCWANNCLGQYLLSKHYQSISAGRQQLLGRIIERKVTTV